MAQFNGPQKSTYALLIGISDYEDEGIKDLNFAHRDAQVFAKFLKTKAGGLVPDENIILLINSEATVGAILDGLDVLRKKVKEGDKFIFYFAGHGRVEEEEIEPLGFLLAYDTPPNNFQRNAFSLEKLNKISKRITLGAKAESILLLDACHAGELVGLNNNGVALTQTQIEDKKALEVRIMACKKDQKSLEISSLDGGRGLFSYYLVKGLGGAAADEEDSIVSFDELKSYIKKNVKKTAEKLNHPGGQTPEFSGEEDIKLAFFDRNTFEADHVSLALVELSNKESGEEEVIASRSMDDEIYKPFDDAIARKDLLTPQGSSAYDIYKKLKRSNKKDKRLPAMKSKLIIKLQDEAQHAINSYLKSDQRELNNRLFIEEAKVYEKYPKYLATAAELAGKDYVNYDGIKAKQYYFEGVNSRLQNSLKSYSKKNLDVAMDLQKKALNHENNAAYIHNEIGVLYLYLKDNEKAKASFEYAMKLSPTWVIPYSNMCVLNNVEKNFEEAKKWGQKSVDLQATYVRGQTNLGTVLEATGNYLQAEHHYRKGIYHNWDFYLGFEKLAFLYTKFGDYKLANHLYKEMEIRKKGTFPIFGPIGELASTDVFIDAPIILSLPSEAELLERIRQNPKDDEAWLSLGKVYELAKRFEEAENCFLKVIEIKPDQYSVYELLGDLYAGYPKGSSYEVNSEIISWPVSNWKRYEDALAYYAIPINSLKDFSGVAASCGRKTWTLLEELERNEEAEDMIERYITEGGGDSFILEGFYNRVVENYPTNPDYWYKRGITRYNRFEEDVASFNLNIIGDFEQTIKLDSLHPSRADIFLKLGKLYVQKGRLKHDFVFEEKNMKSNAEDNHQFEIYDEYYISFQKAINYSEKSNKLRPSQTGPKYQLIGQYLDFFEPQKALNVLEEIMDSSELNFETRQQLIHTLAWTGQIEKAKPYMDWLNERKIGLFKEDHEAAALFYLANKDYQKAITSFEKVLEFNPEDENLQYRIAALHVLNNENKIALTCLEKAIKNGFHFKKVIAYDPAFKTLRATTEFKSLIKKYDLGTETI